MVITRLPRDPFLQHSEALVQHLLEQAPQPASARVLEIGCGRRSPLVPIMNRCLPNHRLHQIDARAEVVAEARRNTPAARVDHAYAHDLRCVANESVDIAIAMSVFDQNAADTMPAIGREIRRVLKPNGSVVYLHNEELNLPATFASFLRSDPPLYLVPSLRWQPLNDQEFCAVLKAQLEAAIASQSSTTSILPRYLARLVPPDPKLSTRRVNVPLDEIITPSNIATLQLELSGLSGHHRLDIQEHSTGELLANLVEKRLFCAENGFEIQSSGIFELHRAVDWKSCFQSLPTERCFARGITRFGVASTERIPPRPDYSQELNSLPDFDRSSEILLIAYQYGLAARKL